MRILLDRCPRWPSAGLEGRGACTTGRADRGELSRILLREDVDAFDPQRLSPGGFLLYRSVPQDRGAARAVPEGGTDGSGGRGAWVTTDEFHKEFDSLPFS